MLSGDLALVHIEEICHAIWQIKSHDKPQPIADNGTIPIGATLTLRRRTDLQK